MDSAERSEADREQIGRWARVRAIPGAKIAVMLGITVGICGPYFGLQRLALLDPRVLPELALDRLVPFSPVWTGAYLSVCALVFLAIVAPGDRNELRIFVRGVTALCVTSFAVFLVFPTEVARHGLIDAPSDGLYSFVVGVDTPRNAFPSLHAGLTTFSLTLLAHIWRPGTALRIAGVLWGVAILYGTLATKQHVVIDILAGGLLGVAALLWAARRARAPAT